MKVCITSPRHSDLEPWEMTRLAHVTRMVKRNREPPFIDLVDDAQQADLIVLLESNRTKTLEYVHELAREDVMRLRPFRVYTINYEDKPMGILPGLYSSLEPKDFRHEFHLSWPHLDCPNPLIDGYTEDRPLPGNPWLFTFSGSCSHPIRGLLFSAYAEPSDQHKVTEVDRFYDHSDDERSSYFNDILNSKYVLCPRGNAPYSHRIIETITLGRVPVVIADDWVPFSIPENGYYVRIRERDISRTHELLRQHDCDYQSTAERVRSVRNKYFAKRKKYAVGIAQLIELHSRVHGAIGNADAHSLYAQASRGA